MNEEVLTLESLGRDFRLDSGRMSELTGKLGIPPCTSRPLAEKEVSALYDAWIEGDDEISESSPCRSGYSVRWIKNCRKKLLENFIRSVKKCC